MTTVPGPDTPAPADNSHETLVSDPKSHDYGRLSPGGNAVGQAGDAPAGVVPGYAINWPGADVGTGGTQTASEVFQGSTLIVPQPDATGHPFGDITGGGTVGDSGPQAAPAPGTPMVAGVPDIDHDGDAV